MKRIRNIGIKTDQQPASLQLRKKPTLRKLNTIPPLTEREPLEWEGWEGHLSSPRDKHGGSTHPPLLVTMEASLPQASILTSGETLNPIQFKVLNQMHFPIHQTPVQESEPLSLTDFLNVQKLHSQSPYTVDAKLKPKI